ncbi:hypothetical protein CLD22_29585, partial [Rubrivivax gelatinosus]|nr:hypothetical protein [Rubrivivax gelatinosus]
MSAGPDDDAWLEALRGRPRPDTSEQTIAEASDLAAAVRRQYDADNAGDEGDDFSLRRVLARLEREHLLDSKRGRFGRILRGPLAAAAVVVLGVLVLYEPPSRELDGEQLRGA